MPSIEHEEKLPLVSLNDQPHPQASSTKISASNSGHPANKNATMVNPKSRLNFIDRATDTTGDILIRRMQNPRMERLAYGNF